jgi:hypothetical protein
LPSPGRRNGNRRRAYPLLEPRRPNELYASCSRSREREKEGETGKNEVARPAATSSQSLHTDGEREASRSMEDPTANNYRRRGSIWVARAWAQDSVCRDSIHESSV